MFFFVIPVRTDTPFEGIQSVKVSKNFMMALI